MTSQTCRDKTDVRVETAQRTPTYTHLNTVRALLALSVLLHHLSGTIALDKYFGVDAYACVFGFGGARVPFFFVLSGFVLTLVYARDFGQPHKTLSFLWRRFVRLYPTYWTILLLVMAPALFFPTLRDAIPSNPEAVLNMFLLLPDFQGSASATGAPVIVVAWTLHYEVVFCLVLAAWIASRPLGLALCVALILNALGCSSTDCVGYRHFLASGSMGYFACGAASAWLVKRLPTMPQAMAIAWAALSVYLFIAVTAQGGREFDWLPDKNLFFLVLACVVLICLVNAQAAQPPRRNSAFVKRLSDSSYAMYLLHFPMVSLICKLVIHAGLRGAAGAAVAFFSTLLICIGSAIMFHLLIERRLLALR